MVVVVLPRMNWRMRAGEEQSAEQHPDADAEREIVGPHHDHHGGDHHQACALRMHPQVSEGGPGKGADGEWAGIGGSVVLRFCTQKPRESLFL